MSAVENTDTHTRRAVLTEAAAQLGRAGIEHARRNAEWMLAHVLACSRAELYAYPTRRVAEEQRRRFGRMVVRRARQEPLQYIVGYEEFYGLQLRVTPHVLIPRPETEEVVEAALRGIKSVEAPRVLDIGTGSGCIALAIRHERPDATVYACDVSADALAVATANAETLGLDVQFFRADVLDGPLTDHVTAPLDLIVSNPPYIPDREASSLAADVHDHEPALALFAGDDPLRFYHAIANEAPALLAEDGRLVLETHADYAGAVRRLLEEAGFTAVQVKQDLAGRARIALADPPAGHESNDRPTSLEGG